MNKQFTFIYACLIAFIFPLVSQAEIYKHVDADGRVTYSNVKIKGAKKIYLEPADTSFGTNTNKETASPASKKTTPKNFPKVDTETQKNRDNSRKQILLSELESERKALESAKKAYDEGASKPEVYRKKNADGSSSTFRNVAKYQEKLKKLQANVDTHQRNIELLEKEISNIN
jgi:outer membrane protein TolC